MILHKGVVENIHDPLKIGRVQVRIVGIHDAQTYNSDIAGLSTEYLPWYNVMSPIGSANISGIGSSPLGILPGTGVYIIFADEYLRDGTVIGTFPVQFANKREGSVFTGFGDPSGMYPTRDGSSTSDLADIELGAEQDLSVVQRNGNLDIALNGNSLGLPPDDSPDYSLYKMLHNDEGYRPQVYLDSEKYPTVGIGHLIVRKRGLSWPEINKILSVQVGREIKTTGGPGFITPEEVQKLFDTDMQRETLEMLKYANVRAAVEAAGDNQPRVWALKNMAFQMGGYGLSRFTTSLELMSQGKWDEASVQLKNSKWFKQTEGRALRVIKTIQSGNLAAYGVRPKEIK